MVCHIANTCFKYKTLNTGDYIEWKTCFINQLVRGDHVKWGFNDRNHGIVKYVNASKGRVMVYMYKYRFVSLLLKLIIFMSLMYDILHILKGTPRTSFKELLYHLKTTLQRRTTTKYIFKH